MENRNFWFAAIALVLIVGAILFQPTVEEQLAPKIENAWVAIEVEGSDQAEVGPFVLEEGTPFTLRAVAGARARDGSPVYYTEATNLVIAGEPVPAEQIRPWDRSKPIKIRWYTVEGRFPFFPLGDDGISAFEYQEFLHPDWPLTWSIPGDIDAAHDDHLEGSEHFPTQLFGTQRYQVRVELYNREDDLVPERVIDSWGVEDLKTQLEYFPTVIVEAASGAALASRAFGLTQLEPPADPSSQLLAQIDELAGAGIAFSRLTLLRDLVTAAGTTFSGAPWQSVELTGTQVFGHGGVMAGDLLRVGDRVVVLYKDGDEGQGEAEALTGFLDYGDLCFDLEQGLEVRQLDEVFSGEGLDVEWASLHSQTSESTSASDGETAP